MVSVTPVHNATAFDQSKIVKKAAIVVEEARATVIGSITDNHKINQKYWKLFKRPPGSDRPATAKHTLDNSCN